jgi:hypothetical protein
MKQITYNAKTSEITIMDIKEDPLVDILSTLPTMEERLASVENTTSEVVNVLTTQLGVTL